MANGKWKKADGRSRGMRRCIVLALSFHLPFVIWHLPCSASTSDQLREAETGQQQVRTRTQSVAGQIDGILSEFESNGIGDNEDVKTLRAVRGVLGSLS